MSVLKEKKCKREVKTRHDLINLKQLCIMTAIDMWYQNNYFTFFFKTNFVHVIVLLILKFVIHRFLWEWLYLSLLSSFLFNPSRMNNWIRQIIDGQSCNISYTTLLCFKLKSIPLWYRYHLNFWYLLSYPIILIA